LESVSIAPSFNSARDLFLRTSAISRNSKSPVARTTVTASATHWLTPDPSARASLSGSLGNEPSKTNPSADESLSAGNVFGAKCARRRWAVHCLKELSEIVQRMAWLVPILSVQSQTGRMRNGYVSHLSSVRPDNPIGKHVNLVTGHVATPGSGLAGGPAVAEGPHLSELLRRADPQGPGFAKTVKLFATLHSRNEVMTV
jgi:hypothetical protein